MVSTMTATVPGHEVKQTNVQPAFVADLWQIIVGLIIYVLCLATQF